MKKEYKSPEITIVDVFESTCPLCASVNSLPPLTESGDMGNLDWN